MAVRKVFTLENAREEYGECGCKQLQGGVNNEKMKTESSWGYKG